MKDLTVYETFKGYDDIIIPPELNKTMTVKAIVSPSMIDGRSLLFVTEKVKDKTRSFNTDALKSTPFAIVASKDCVVNSGSIPVIRAGSVRSALAYALSNAYEIDYEKIKFIGITGTNGKTTTATLIYRILQGCGYKVGFIGTGKIISDREYISGENYSMTTPDPTELYPAISRMSKDGCKYIVMEVSSHSIALGKVAPIKFEYGIFTNLDNDHLDFHSDKEDYFRTKLKMFKSVKHGLFNLDDEYSRRAYELAGCKKTSFGIIRQGDTWASEINMRLNKTEFYYREKNIIAKVSTSLTGAFNVYNSLAALRCAIDLGVPPCVAKRCIEDTENVEGRMEIIRGDITVVIDYAHTPSAFYNCLKTLKQTINKGQKLTVVFGCGGDRDRSKRQFFGKYAEMLADLIIITEDNSRNEKFDSITADILDGISKNNHIIVKDRESAIRYAIGTAALDDVVAIVGKGHEKYKIENDRYIPFDEKQIIESALAERSNRYESKN